MPNLGLYSQLYAFGKRLKLKFIRYEVTSERVRLREGLLSVKSNDLELYRIKDVTVHQPLLQRLFSVGILSLYTSDKSHPQLDLRGIPKANELREKIRASVEALRDIKRVREVDIGD